MSPNYFFYNTDAGAIKEQPKRRFPVLIEKGFAAAGGQRKYGENFAPLAEDDFLLMYENGVGVVAVGRVKERWNGQSYDEPWYYTKKEMRTFETGAGPEYRIAVDWFIPSPPTVGVNEIREHFGTNPRGGIQRIVKHRAAAAKLIDELARHSDGQSTLADDLKTLVGKKVDSTTKDALISARVGQGPFRSQVLRLWDNHCAVTRSTTLDAIRASHIKPWRDSTDEERLDPYNGLPLLANLDALFDAGLISFDSSGALIVSRLLPKPEQRIFVLQRQRLARKLAAKTAQYLIYHRDHIFREG